MKNIKYLLLGVVLTLSGLFVFLNTEEISISFLFAEVKTKVSIAILIAFFLGLFSGMLMVLLGRSNKKEVVVEKKKELPKKENESEDKDRVYGIPLE